MYLFFKPVPMVNHGIRPHWWWLFFLYSCTRLTQGECIQQLIGLTPIALLGTGNCSDLWVNQLSLYFKLILVNLVPEVGALVQLFQNTFIKKNKFKKKLPVLTFDLLYLCNFQLKKRQYLEIGSVNHCVLLSGTLSPKTVKNVGSYTQHKGVSEYDLTLFI